ncbi:MAG: hypothetical protein K9M99_09550 [Candidatus Cloacimonetes bacterium]|nr:hypothetical protein [Candidatus Cloacimonadota bacterium]
MFTKKISESWKANVDQTFQFDGIKRGCFTAPSYQDHPGLGLETMKIEMKDKFLYNNALSIILEGTETQTRDGLDTIKRAVKQPPISI